MLFLAMDVLDDANSLVGLTGSGTMGPLRLLFFVISQRPAATRPRVRARALRALDAKGHEANKPSLRSDGEGEDTHRP